MAESARLTDVSSMTGPPASPPNGQPTTQPHQPIPVEVSVASALVSLGPGLLKIGNALIARSGGSWIPGVVVAILAVVIGIWLHDTIGDGNLVKALDRRDKITETLVDRLDRQDARIEDLEKLAERVENVENTQDQLLQAHRNEHAVRAWRDDAMIDIAKAQGLTLRRKPQPVQDITRKK
jgi:hypothetical protein